MTARHQERRFDPAYAETLVRIAEQDFKSGRFLENGVPTKEARPENVLFLYQQAMEKLLKAVLCHLEIPVPMVHDLGVLLAKLPSDTQPNLGYEIARLNDFAGMRRYEEGALVWQPEDLADGRAMCEELLTWTKSVVGETEHDQ